MKKYGKTDYPIDFVLTWVDGNDSNWQDDYCKYKGIDGDHRDYRFRDMGTLKYWFRGVEQFAPWVNKIYFVTCGQKPDWLNTEHPKVVCVDHKDFIPEKYLPTFSSQAIEINLHRIKGLSEHFVYFNDDMFLTSPTTREDFFIGGRPCDSAVINYPAPRIEPLNLVPYVNIAAINRNFNKKTVMRKQAAKLYTLKYHKYVLKNIQFIMGKFFPGFKYFHLPSSFLKSTFEEVWKKEEGLLERTSAHKFRVLTDCNQWLFQNWQICTGKFKPRDVNVGYYGAIEDDKRLFETVNAIMSRKYKMVCANDGGIENFDLLARELEKAFEEILPEKSEYEL